jgi:rhodanese-related sulfurtransferase
MKWTLFFFLKRTAWREAAVLAGVALFLGIGVNAVRRDGLSWAPPPSREPGIDAEGFFGLSLPETVRWVQQGKGVVLDARSQAAWKAGRIPGAWPLPLERADEAFEHLRPFLTRPEEPLLVYCASAGCDESLHLARFLREQGYQAVAIVSEGFSAWKAAGLPVERSDE